MMTLSFLAGYCGRNLDFFHRYAACLFEPFSGLLSFSKVYLRKSLGNPLSVVGPDSLELEFRKECKRILGKFWRMTAVSSSLTT